MPILIDIFFSIHLNWIATELLHFTIENQSVFLDQGIKKYITKTKILLLSR